MADVKGGDRLGAALQKISDRLGASSTAPSVAVGFLEGGTYPNGTSIPMVAATHEFGGTINRAASQQTVYRSVNAGGTAFLRGGRFVKRRSSNFASTHAVGAYTITIPPRPYFRPMIAAKSKTWGPDLAKILKATSFDAQASLAKMGHLIKGQLQDSIKAVSSPPLAASTIRRKGFSKPLIDTGVMWNSIDFIVTA